VRNSRDPEPCLLAKKLLQPIECPNALPGINPVTSQRPSDLPKTVTQQTLQPARSLLRVNSSFDRI
jgi:hypothetical protein